MFDFAVKGTITGFWATKDGSKQFVKIQPQNVTISGLDREQRPGQLSVQLPANAPRNLAMNTLLQIRGKGYVIFKDYKDRNNKDRTGTDVRFEAETIEPVKVAA